MSGWRLKLNEAEEQEYVTRRKEEGEQHAGAGPHRGLVLTFGHLHDLVAGTLDAHFVGDHTMANANERTRVARILVLLDRHVAACASCDGLNVDSEHSRVGAGLTDKELRGQRAFPDVLLHRRTVQSANVLALEVKLRESSRPRTGPDREDAVKIDIMTGYDHGLPYAMVPYAAGLCLNLDDNSAEGWWTVPAVGLHNEYERFAWGPSPILVGAFDVSLWTGVA